MVAIGAAPPVSPFPLFLGPRLNSASQILQLCLLGVLPESPRYLLRHNKLAPTLKILAKVYPYATPAQIEMKASVISASVRENMGSDRNFIATWKQLHFVGANFRGLVIACGLQGIQQLSGAFVPTTVQLSPNEMWQASTRFCITRPPCSRVLASKTRSL